MVQTESCESEEASESLNVQVIKGIVTEAQPLDVLQALEYHIRQVHKLVVGEGQQIEEAKLRESPWLDLLYPVPVNKKLLQGG